MVTAITTGEQTVTATGAITGTLTTTGLAASGFVKVRVRGLAAGQSLRIALEDTANVTPFSDALQVWTFDTAAGQNPDGNEYSVAFYQMPDVRFGGANNKLRLNVQAITASTSVQVLGWLEQ